MTSAPWFYPSTDRRSRTRPPRRATGGKGDAVPTPKSTISLVIIDDNRLVREGLALLIREQPDFTIIAAAADVEEALRKVRESKPHVVLVDFSLGDNDSVLFTRSVCREVPEARVIIMGVLPIQDEVGDFVRAGASGFVMKDASLEQFITTIRSVAAGGKVLPTELAGSIFTEITSRVIHAKRTESLEGVRLTQRERQVVDLIGEGLSNKDIAARLHVAVHTVKSHVHNVLEKLALHSRLEVAAFTRTTDDR
jgi:DNA-binding NarL/FixJ family response regulator